MVRLVAALALIHGFGGMGFGQSVPTPEIELQAIRLGDRDYRIREEAGKQFLLRGSDALPTLRQVAKSADIEASGRAFELIQKIEKRTENAKLMAGLLVEIPAGANTLGAALDSIAKQIGCQIHIDGNQSPRSVAVTPVSGKICFWDAVDALIAGTDLEVFPQIQDVSPNLVLRKRIAKTANPVCVSGAFRIEAIPGTLAYAQQFQSDRISALLHIAPEPGRRWIGHAEVFPTAVRDQDARTLSLDHISIDAPHTFVANGFGGGALGANGGVNGGFFAGAGGFGGNGNFGNLGAQFGLHGAALLSQWQVPVKFQPHRDGTSRTLKTFDGIIRGKFRGPTETLLAIPKLGGEFQSTAGEKQSCMNAKIEPLHGEPASRMLTVIVHYDCSDCTPSVISDGLTVVDADGTPLKLTALDSSTQMILYGDGSYQIHCLTASYAVRAAKPGDRIDPQKVVFSGSRVKSVEIPFRLKDVPLIRGTAVIPTIRTTGTMDGD